MTLPVFCVRRRCGLSAWQIPSACVVWSPGGVVANLRACGNDSTKPFHLEQLSVALLVSSPCLRASVSPCDHFPESERISSRVGCVGRHLVPAFSIGLSRRHRDTEKNSSLGDGKSRDSSLAPDHRIGPQLFRRTVASSVAFGPRYRQRWAACEDVPQYHRRSLAFHRAVGGGSADTLTFTSLADGAISSGSASSYSATDSRVGRGSTAPMS